MSAGCGWTSYVSGFRDPGNDRGEAPSARLRADGVARPTANSSRELFQNLNLKTSTPNMKPLEPKPHNPCRSGQMHIRNPEEECVV